MVSISAGSVDTAPLRGSVVLAIFFCQALSNGSLMTRIADIQLGLGLSESQLGLALMGGPAGGFASFLVSGAIVERFGTRRVLLWGLPGLVIGTWATALAPGAWSLFWIGVIYGVVFNLTNVAMNVEADRFEAATGQRVMNRCHGLWSAGMLLTALGGVLARGVQISAPMHFGLLIPVLLLATLLLLGPMVEAAPRALEGPRKKIRFALPTVATLGLVGFAFAGGFAQMGTQNWSVIYMRDTFGAPDWVDTLTLPAFLLTLTIGRMFADGWNARFGPGPVTLVLVGGGLVGVLAVIFAQDLWQALAGFGLMGLGTCGLFPLMISAAAKIGDRPAADNVSSVIMMTGLVMLAAPPLMGFIAEAWGMRVAYTLLVPAFLLTLGLARRVGARG